MAQDDEAGPWQASPMRRMTNPRRPGMTAIMAL